MDVLLLKSDYRYNYLIEEAMEKGDIKRLKSFIKMGRLIPLWFNSENKLSFKEQ